MADTLYIPVYKKDLDIYHDYKKLEALYDDEFRSLLETMKKESSIENQVEIYQDTFNKAKSETITPSETIIEDVDYEEEDDKFPF